LFDSLPKNRFFLAHLDFNHLIQDSPCSYFHRQYTASYCRSCATLEHTSRPLTICFINLSDSYHQICSKVITIFPGFEFHVALLFKPLKMAWLWKLNAKVLGEKWPENLTTSHKRQCYLLGPMGQIGHRKPYH